MPTEPLKSVLDRTFAIANAKEIIDNVSPKLQEVVNYATNVFARCITVAVKQDRSYALPFLYLHMIEMTDSIEILMSNSIVNAAIPLARSSFEALLSIEYILKENTELRALAWEAEFMRKELHLYKSYNPSTPEGQNLRNILQNDRFIGIANPKYPPKFDEFIKNYEARLNLPKFQPIQQEFNRVKALLNRKSPDWYQLFGPKAPDKTPNTLYELAKHVERPAMYAVFYKEWSSIHHAHNPARFALTTENKTQAIRPLRDPTQMELISASSINFLVTATMSLLSEFRPGEEKNFAKWCFEILKK